MLRIYAEFQGFARDLHDLTAQAVVLGAGVDPRHQALLITAVTRGRRLDTGNAGLDAVAQDFRRLGLKKFDETVKNHYRPWSGTTGKERYDADKKRYGDLTDLRNAVAHGNDRQLRDLHDRGVRPFKRCLIRNVLPALSRRARAMDEVVWDHVVKTFGVSDPWTPR